MPGSRRRRSHPSQLMTDSFYSRSIFPALAHLDPETAHHMTLDSLALAQSNPAGRAILRAIAGAVPSLPVQVGSLRFPNPIGLAAGFDKDARAIRGLALLGFGHIEVGTLTPAPQAGNPRPRIFRLREDRALINRMGFPNEGVASAAHRLRLLISTERNFVLGVSLGKQKDTPLAGAARDFISVMQAVYPFADYLAVNISSPNTPGLRELQGQRFVSQLLVTLINRGKEIAAESEMRPRPIWVKIAPDLSLSELDIILEALSAAGGDGMIVANTTTSRDGLASPAAGEAGGLSGPPLRKRVTELIAHVYHQTSGTLPIIGVGGISSAADVQETLAAGASVVQLYTSMVYAGPGLPGRILRDLAGLQT